MDLKLSCDFYYFQLHTCNKMWIVLRYNCNFIFHARQFESDFRSKKETNYDDKMSEKEWLKAIGAEEEDYDGSSSDEEEVQLPKKRGRGRTFDA